MGFCQQESNPESKSAEKPQQAMEQENNSFNKLPQLVASHVTGASNKQTILNAENTNIPCEEAEPSAHTTVKISPSGYMDENIQDENKNTLNCSGPLKKSNQNSFNTVKKQQIDDKKVNNCGKNGIKAVNCDENENLMCSVASVATSLDNINLKSPSKKKGSKVIENEEDSAIEGQGLSLKDFSLLKTLGKGAFGDVFLVKKNCGTDVGSLYALKMVYKVKVKDDESFEVHFKCEREALETVRGSTFLSQLYFAFQTAGHLFIVMDFNSGGQLLQQFTGNNALLIHEVKFYLAELLLAVSHLHAHGIIHRDIKPENILLDKEGHVVLIDYGLSKHIDGSPNESYVGTEPYIAPEILLHKPHDRVADFWSIGILGYEMITGNPPFDLSLPDEQLKKSVLGHEIRYPAKFFPKTTKSLFNGLLQKNPKGRLGASTKNNPGGVKVVMDHQFFKAIDWKLASARKLKPPVIPKPEDLSSVKVKNFKEPRFCSFRKHFTDYEFSWLESKEAESL